MRSDRLLVLAAHLKSDRRGHKRFAMWTVTQGPRDPERYGCGTAGCAFGELPVVWPEIWEFARYKPKSKEYYVKLKSQDSSHRSVQATIHGAMEFFELEEVEVDALFFSGHSHNRPALIPVLQSGCTAKQVADRFIAFVKWREEQSAPEKQDA